MNPDETDLLSESLEFGGYVLDADLRELRGPAGRIDIQRKVLHLLFYLARHSQRVVGKEELLAAVWPGMVVSDSVLSQAVRKARGALGDDGAAQSLIRTVHGQGYRLEAEVRRSRQAPSGPGSPQSEGGAEGGVTSGPTEPLAPAFDPLEHTVVPALAPIEEVPEAEAVPQFGPLSGTPPTASEASTGAAPPFAPLPARAGRVRRLSGYAVVGVAVLLLGAVALGVFS